MPDLLKTGSDWLAGRLKSHVSQSITYRRGILSRSLLATIGSTAFELTDHEQRLTRVESRDYLVTAADLLLGGKVELPKRGDLIEETINGVVHLYQVLAPGGEDVYSFSDRYNTTLRVHTKFLKTD